MEKRINNYQNDEIMDFDNKYIENCYSKKDNILSSDNSLEIIGSYDINQMTKKETTQTLLKVKMNKNIPNEFALINSNFQVHYMSLSDEGMFHVNSLASEHTERINDVCFFQNSSNALNKALITGSNDGTIKIWDSRAKESVKTLTMNKGQKVFTLDTNTDILVAGMEREIGVWDLKMMKQMHKVKFAHSEDVTFVKLKNNFLITGGEDSIINIFDLSVGFNMDSIVSQANLNQPVGSLDFLDEEFNYIQALTLVQTYHIFNMFTGGSAFEFDAKNETFKSDYLIDGYLNRQTNYVDLFCGNTYGDIILLDIDLTSKDIKLKFNSRVNTNYVQSFNSIEKLSFIDNHFILVSDEGILTLVKKKNEEGASFKSPVIQNENEEMSAK